jgi:uncharacterized protein YecT (DUF1311 family)
MTIHGLAVCALLGTAMSFALVNAAEAAATASFDCARTSAPIEKLICSNDDLAALDAALGQAYGARRQGLSRDEAAALRRDQRQWLADRLAACDAPGALDASSPDETVPCLLDLYRERMLALGGTVPGPRGRPLSRARHRSPPILAAARRCSPSIALAGSPCAWKARSAPRSR